MMAHDFQYFFVGLVTSVAVWIVLTGIATWTSMLVRGSEAEARFRILFSVVLGALAVLSSRPRGDG